MPRGRKKVQWSTRDLFTVPLTDGSRVIGQILDIMLPNIVSAAFVGERVDHGASLPDLGSIHRKHLVAALSTWRDPLDSGHWPIIGRKDLLLSRREWPNEQYRSNNWIGAKHQSTAAVEAFLHAYFGMRPWDAWQHDPLFYDKLLLEGVKRPGNVVLSKSTGLSSAG
jgi:hypothetical protein